MVAEHLTGRASSPIQQAALREAVLEYALDRGGRDTSSLEPRVAFVQEEVLEATQVSAMTTLPTLALA